MDPELDRAIAKRLFGMTDDQIYCWPTQVPYFSSDWNAVRRVIEEMQRRGWKWCMHSPDLMDDTGACGCYFQKAMPDGSVCEPEAYADDLPTAVCRAALMALES